MVVNYFYGDGNLEVVIYGNDDGNEVANGRYDAMNGLVMPGNGEGKYVPQTIMQSDRFSVMNELLTRMFVAILLRRKRFKASH